MRHKSQAILIAITITILMGACAPTAVPAATTTLTPKPTLVFPTLTAAPSRTSTMTFTPTSTPAAAPLPGALQIVIAIEDIMPGNIQRLLPAVDGGLWLVSDQAVVKWNDTNWKVSLPDYEGEAAGIDSSNRIWVVSQDTSRISAWDGDNWSDYDLLAGWQPIGTEDDWYRGVGWGQNDRQGRLWLNTTQDVRLFDGERWRVFTAEDMSMAQTDAGEFYSSFVVHVSQSSGAVWVGQCNWGGPGPFGGMGVRWFDGKAWLGADSPVASGCTTVIAEDQSGQLWFGVDENLWRYQPTTGVWTRFPPPEPPLEGMRFGFTDSIQCDQSGDPWPALVLCGGASCYGNIALYHMHDSTWTQIGEVADYEGKPYELFFSADAVWLLRDNAIYRLSGDSPEWLADLYLQSAAVDNSGQIWLAAYVQGQAMLMKLEADKVK